jgi:cytochrome c oxidase cbb3-type subunit 3
MSDFTSGFWSLYVALLTIVSIAACAWLLMGQQRRRAAGEPVETTGHEWDGDLAEYNNPLPRWWMGLFWLTIVFSIAYLAFYPGLGTFQGWSGWSSQGQYREEQASADAQFGAIFQKYASMEVEAIAKDPQARAMGERLFLTYCSQCHGSDARGGKGYPNLTDGDWLYGGDGKTILASILDGRQGTMPALGAALGSPEAVNEVANYVLSLSGAAHDAARAAAGKPRFVVCTACHGPDGKGNPALGAPNLADKVWLHGWGEEAITEIVNKGKTNVMPAQEGRLTPGQIHLLASYVWSLSQPRRVAQR